MNEKEIVITFSDKYIDNAEILESLCETISGLLEQD